MTDDVDEADPNLGSENLGEPIAQLAVHVVPVSTGFRGRVGRAIERRVLAADATRFGVLAPFEALLELMRMIFESLGLLDRPSIENESGQQTGESPAES